MSKKHTMWFAVLMLAVLLSCANAMGETQSGVCGDCTWTLTDDGTLTVSGTGKISGLPEEARSAKTLVIESGVMGIGDYAFASFSELTAADIPDTLISIGQYAFSGCSEMDIVLPDTLERIEWGAFYQCKVPSELVLPEGLKYLDSYAFSSTAVEKAFLPEQIEFVGGRPFPDETKMYASLQTAARVLTESFYPTEQPAIRLIYLRSGDQITGLKLNYVDPTVTFVKIPEGVTSIDTNVLTELDTHTYTRKKTAR